MSSLLFKINSDRTKPWNELPELPINESFYRNVEVLEALVNAKSALAKLYGRSVLIPNQGLLINTISLQEAKISSAIENIFTTDDELYKAYSDENEDTSQAAKEVLKYREALWTGFHFLNENEKFSEEYFIEIFRVIKQTSDSIRPEFLNTVIKQGGTGPNAGKIIYTPPKGTKIIKDKLKNLIDFLNDDDKYKIDPLIKMAIAHFQFEAIHPFRDGNGRTGRVFNIHFLTNKGLLDVPILFLSRYILDHKDDYYGGLNGVTQRGDWKTWIIFMLNAIESTSNLTFEKINTIVSSQELILEFIKRELKIIKKPNDLIQFIYKQPFTKVSHLVKSKLFAEKTARDYLNLLCEHQILEKKTFGGHFYYLNIELYRILSE